MAETISDFIPVTSVAAVCAVINFFMAKHPNEAKRFWAFLYVYELNFHAIDSLGLLVTIALFNHKELAYMVGVLYPNYCCIFCSYYIPTNDMTDILKVLSNGSIVKFTLDAALIVIYGWDRCPLNQVSELLYQLNIKNDIFWEYLRD